MSTLKFSQRERLPEIPLVVLNGSINVVYKKKCCKKFKKGKRCKKCPGN